MSGGGAPAAAPAEGGAHPTPEKKKGHDFKVLGTIGHALAHAIAGFGSGIRNVMGGVWDAGPGQAKTEIERGSKALGYEPKGHGFVAKTTGVVADLTEKTLDTVIAKPVRGAYYLAKTPLNMLRTAGQGVSRAIGGVGHAISGFFGAFVPKKMKEWWAHGKKKPAGNGHAKEEHKEDAGHEKKPH